MKLDFMKIGIFAYFMMRARVYEIPIYERSIMIIIVAIGFFVDWYMVKFWIEVYWKKYFKKKK